MARPINQITIFRGRIKALLEADNQTRGKALARMDD